MATVVEHYEANNLLKDIEQGLVAQGKDLNRLTLDDLAPIEEFHVRGREASLELANLAGISSNDSVLDVGCGIGGPARLLASTKGCRVDGIDLTPSFIGTANALTMRLGLEHLVKFHLGNAMDIPFHDKSFDVCWTQHVQMNIADKKGFVKEMSRVLKSGGRLAEYDLFLGEGQPDFPVPWASEPENSHLVKPEAMRAAVEAAGLEVIEWVDCTDQGRAWIQNMLEKAGQGPPPPVGPQLLFGERTKLVFGNAGKALLDGRLRVVMFVARKP